jgi:hypothetical protein
VGMMKRKGRPKLPTDDVLKLRRIRISDSEWELWNEVAGPGRVSSYIRTVVNRAATRELAKRSREE